MLIFELFYLVYKLHKSSLHIITYFRHGICFIWGCLLLKLIKMLSLSNIYSPMGEGYKGRVVRFHFWTSFTSHFTLLGTTLIRDWTKRKIPLIHLVIRALLQIGTRKPLFFSNFSWSGNDAILVCNLYMPCL